MAPTGRRTDLLKGRFLTEGEELEVGIKENNLDHNLTKVVKTWQVLNPFFTANFSTFKVQKIFSSETRKSINCACKIH